ncbi:MAG: hypothetical protein ACI4UE_05905 [Candidatus Scatovivens sp.]
MFDLIFIIIIIIIVTNYLKSKKIIINNKMLEANGFSKIQQLSENQKYEYCSAIRNGDNYLILFIRSVNLPTMSDINLLATEMKNKHFHKGIIVCLGQPNNRLIEYAKVNCIEIKSALDLKNGAIQSSSNSDNIKNEEKSIEIYNIRKDTENKNQYQFQKMYNENDEGPLKEPTKTSFWTNFFKKPDRL